MAGRVAAHQFDLLRPGADEAHVALQHVQELGSLSRLVRRSTRPSRVTRGSETSLNMGSGSFSKGTASAGPPRVGVHRAELVDREFAAGETGARLGVERRPSRHPDRDHDHREERRGEQQHDARDGDVQHPLQQQGRAGDSRSCTRGSAGRRRGGAGRRCRTAAAGGTMLSLIPSRRHRTTSSAIGARRPRRVRPRCGRRRRGRGPRGRRPNRRVLADDRGMDVGEEVDLPPDRVGELPAADEDDPLGGVICRQARRARLRSASAEASR